MSNHKHWSQFDEELAEKVMGWKLVRLSDPEWEGYWSEWDRNIRMRLRPDGDEKLLPDWIPSFSTDMNEAMQLCEKIMEKHGFLLLLQLPSNIWEADILRNGVHEASVCDASPAMAIAKAALAFCTVDASVKR